MTKTRDELLEIFVRRPHRYRLLEKGATALGLKSREEDMPPMLEVGCAYGDASSYIAGTYGVRMTGIDFCENIINRARQLHAALIEKGLVDFCCGRAEEIPFRGESFGGLLLEAAFSPIESKLEAVNEFYRVLEPKSRVLLNDFALKEKDVGGSLSVSGIPCFKGVASMQEYIDLFKKAGFHLVEAREEYGEFIALAMWVAKSLRISISDVGPYLSQFHSPDFLTETCGGYDTKKPEGFKITYCQMIFEKR